MAISKVVQIIKESYNYDTNLVDASTLECFVQDGFGLFQSCKERKQDKLIFGSLKDWKRFNKGIITKEEFNSIKNSSPILFVGRSNESRGNRKIKLDIENNTVIFKKSKKEHHVLNLQTSNSRLKMLRKLQDVTDTTKTSVTYRLNQDYLWIIFDETVLKEKEHNFIENRIGSLDLNPNYIAFTIQDFSKDIPTQVHKSVFDLTKLNDTHNKNKKDYEVVQIAKTISKLCSHYKVECVGIEKLSIISKDLGKGKRLNRLINNSWNRNCFVNNLKKRLNILGIQNQEIVAAYSSTVGCLDNPQETDSVAASLEIGRRCYVFLNRFIKKRKEFSDVDVIYPKINRGLIKERWNSILSDYNPKNIGYKGIHEYLKKEKKLNELRFLFKNYDFSSWSCFRLNSKKSMVTCVSMV